MNYKTLRNKLIKFCGIECFIDKLNIRERSEGYTGVNQRKKIDILTFHHIKMKKDRGPDTMENGALLSVENHRWFNNQPKNEQNKINKMFQNYKIESMISRKHPGIPKEIVEEYIDNIDDYEIAFMELQKGQKGLNINPFHCTDEDLKEGIVIKLENSFRKMHKEDEYIRAEHKRDTKQLWKIYDEGNNSYNELR